MTQINLVEYCRRKRNPTDKIVFRHRGSKWWQLISASPLQWVGRNLERFRTLILPIKPPTPFSLGEPTGHWQVWGTNEHLRHPLQQRRGFIKWYRAKKKGLCVRYVGFRRRLRDLVILSPTTDPGGNLWHHIQPSGESSAATASSANVNYIGCNEGKWSSTWSWSAWIDLGRFTSKLRALLAKDAARQLDGKMKVSISVVLSSVGVYSNELDDI